MFLVAVAGSTGPALFLAADRTDPARMDWSGGPWEIAPPGSTERSVMVAIWKMLERSLECPRLVRHRRPGSCSSSRARRICAKARPCVCAAQHTSRLSAGLTPSARAPRVPPRVVAEHRLQKERVQQVDAEQCQRLHRDHRDREREAEYLEHAEIDDRLRESATRETPAAPSKAPTARSVTHPRRREPSARPPAASIDLKQSQRHGRRGLSRGSRLGRCRAARAGRADHARTRKPSAPRPRRSAR